MARNAFGGHNTVATGSDSGDQVSVNAWNTGHDQDGMLGFTPSTKTIASGKITPVDTATVVAAESGTADNLDLITYSETSANDLLYLFADSGDTITVRHNQSPGSGEATIITTSAGSITLSETIPLVLQRRGTTFYQIIENSISTVTAGSTTTFTNKSIDLTDNTLTGSSAELATAISDETGSGNLVFATSPTLVTPVLGTPASGALTNCTFPTLNQSTTGSSATCTGLSATATALATTRAIGGVNFDGSAAITPANITVADTTNTSCSVALFESATGDLPPKSDGGLTYNAATGTLTATAFAGPLTGNVTGNTSGTSGSTTGNAATATALATSRTIGGTSFDGTANIAVTLSATATALATARNIGGVSFDGTANITLPGVNSAGNQNTTGSAASLSASLAPSGITGTAAILGANTFTGAQDLGGNNLDNIQNLIHDLTTTASVSGAQTLDFNADQLETWALSGSTSITFATTSNKAVGRSKTIRLVNDGTLQNLTLHSSWKIVGTAPSDIAASKTGILTVTCFGAAETDIVAAYAVVS